LQQLVGMDNVYSADLFSSDNLYLWENTNSEKHTCLSDNTKNSWEIFKKFKSAVLDNGIDVVCIPGYQQKIYLLFILWAKIKGIKIIMFAESWYRSNIIIEFCKSVFLRLSVSSFFVSGERAKKHFIENLHIPERKVAIGYSVVDNNHFRQALKLEKNEKPTLLCVARYAKEKNLGLLVAAFKKSELHDNWQLQIVGEGPLRETLLVEQDDSVQFSGWKSYKDLPRLYSSADCFVLPSVFEPWGLVVNEAMAAGLPIIISNQCGCVPELFNSKNGWIFDTNNVEELIKIMNDLSVKNTREIQCMGLESSKIIENYSCETWANTIVELAL